MAFPSAFQGNAFQHNAFQIDPLISSTHVLHKPVDYVLAGQQHYKQSGREFEIRPRDIKTSGAVPRSRVSRLKGSPPSFSVTSNNRGYD